MQGLAIYWQLVREAVLMVCTFLLFPVATFRQGLNLTPPVDYSNQEKGD